MSPGNAAQSLGDRAMALQASGQHEKAVEMVRLHLRIRPRDTMAASLMGVLLRGIGDLAVEPEMPGAGPITFGSFNNSAKIGPESAALWARVLDAVPGSRLLLKTQTLADPSAQRELRGRLTKGGIAEHLALYGRVHVALDSTPYNGTTTTCEALWMGVPVVALRGDRHASRVSASLLSAAGHPEWVAENADGFVRIATSLAGDLPRLAAIRSTLREDLRASQPASGS